MAFAVKKRCPMCLKRVGENGHCANPTCKLYHPIEDGENTEPQSESVENSEGKE